MSRSRRLAALGVLGVLGVLGLGGAVVAVAAPAAVPAPTALPAPRPTLTMRAPARPAHGGFVADLDCSACHTTAGWRLSARAGASGFDHARTGFPLRGGHVAAACSACHTGAGTPATTCEGCHRDPHAGRHDEGCAGCHTPTAWADTQALEQHRRTRMPLTGRHAQLPCVDCHTRQGGRTFSDLPVDCYACHRAAYHRADVHPVHDGRTGEPMLSRDCARCHQTSRWSPAYADPLTLSPVAVARTGAHDAWFVLSSGSHRAAACASCHVAPRRVKLVRCDGCHDDLALRRQHRGVTQPRAAAACLRCHPRGAAR